MARRYTASRILTITALFLGGLLVGDYASAADPTATTAQVSRIVPHADGQVHFLLFGDRPPANCAGHAVYLIPDGDKGRTALLSVLELAYATKDRVTVYSHRGVDAGYCVVDVIELVDPAAP